VTPDGGLSEDCPNKKRYLPPSLCMAVSNYIPVKVAGVIIRRKFVKSYWGRHAVRRTYALASVVLLAIAALVLVAWSRPGAGRFIVEPSALILPADGSSSATFTIRSNNRQSLEELKVGDETLAHRIAITDTDDDDQGRIVSLRAGTRSGEVVVSIQAPGLAPAELKVRLLPATSDSFGDGTPDFLRLDDPDDRSAFRKWFTFLAEQQYFRGSQRLPVEIVDCAALIRFAYREALREHDSTWAKETHLSSVPVGSSVQKYQYPFTDLGAGLFRIHDGVFTRTSLSDGSFAQFADASVLRRFNTHFVGRDLHRALPGDLLFFRQPDQRMPDHAMIFLGQSQFSDNKDLWVIYHTGPHAEDQGEIRRLTVNQLLAFPLARWRPVPYNPAFLGVYRWNVLRGDD